MSKIITVNDLAGKVPAVPGPEKKEVVKEKPKVTHKKKAKVKKEDVK